MIYIVNKEDKIVGFLKNNDSVASPFFDDIHNNKIAENGEKIYSETLELSVPYGYPSTELLDEGMQLLKRDTTGRWKLFTIYQVEDSINGITHTKRIYAINSLIWDMNHRYIEERSWTAANSRDVFLYIFQRVGWSLDNFNEFYSGGTKSFSLSNGKRQQALDEATKEFAVEVEAYVVIRDGNVLDKRVLLTDKLGEVTGQRFEYRHNLKGATRKKSNDEFYTKLYVFGGTNDKGERVSIANANKVKVKGTKGSETEYEYLPFLLDDEANDKYNEGRQYLEGYIVNEDIKKPEGLYHWGKEQFKYYNHPHYDYEIDVALLGTRPDIGDTVAVVDHEMVPPLTISARVLETNYSESNKNSDSVVLGEFVTINTITPNLIWQLQALANQALQKAEEKFYRMEIYTPDGSDFENQDDLKQIIVRVYDGMTMITESIPPQSFIWQKIDSDGLHDKKWEKKYEGKGSVITVGIETADSTIRCLVDGEATMPIVFTKEEDFEFFCKLQNEPLGLTDFNYRVAQYAQVEPVKKRIFWSQVYSGEKLTAFEKAAGESFSLTRTDFTGKIIDRMWCKLGGHGSHFGIELIGDDTWIYTSYTQPIDANSRMYHIVKFKYEPNKVITLTDTIKIVDDIRTNVQRINMDNKNGWMLTSEFSTDKAIFNISKKSLLDKKSDNPSYIVSASYFGVTPRQTYQSACLDFPYLYVTYGGANGTITNGDYPVMYCVDVRTNSIVYKIDYTFNHAIKPNDELHEPETISYYYDTDGTKWLIQGFAFSHENDEYTRKNNMLYRARERKRVDD